jgi:hypothetical protein
MEVLMEVFVVGCLSACLLIFLVMASVSLIGMEKKIVDTVRLVEKKVTEMYEEE